MFNSLPWLHKLIFSDTLKVFKDIEELLRPDELLTANFSTSCSAEYPSMIPEKKDRNNKRTFTTWARFRLFSQGIKFTIPRSLSTI